MKRLILTAVASALILAACNSQPPYLGRWQRHVISVSHPEGTIEVLELSPEGRLVLRPPPFPDMSATGMLSPKLRNFLEHHSTAGQLLTLSLALGGGSIEARAHIDIGGISQIF